MIIRTAKTEDAAEISKLLNEIIRVGGTTALQAQVSVGEQTVFIQRQSTVTSFHVALDEETGLLLDFQYLEPHIKLAPRVATIATFARVGSVQRGIGTALFEATKTAAKTAGYQEVDATIRADNTGGLAYYSKMGFQDYSVAKAVPLADGTQVDRISKRLKLG